MGSTVWLGPVRDCQISPIERLTIGSEEPEQIRRGIPRQLPGKTCPQQLLTSRDRRNGCRENGGDGHPPGNRRDSHGVPPRARSSAREYASSRVLSIYGSVCISPDSPSSPQCGGRPRDHRAGDAGGHRAGSPCGHYVSRPYGHNWGRAGGCEHLNAAGEFQTWFIPFHNVALGR